MNQEISKNIFRAYDIRGLYQKEINPELFYKIGLAAGKYVKNVVNGHKLTVGCDNRKSSPALLYSFVSGVVASGINVTLTGVSSFGQTLFTGWELKQDLIGFVTASHLTADWNGIKFYYGDGVGLPEKELMKIRDFVLSNELEQVNWRSVGSVKNVDPKEDYSKFFEKNIVFKKHLKVALDCGGGSMTLSAPDIFKALNLDIIPVFCESDPFFSKRPSDPKPKNLKTLVNVVKQNNCDFGVAFDGDGDRSVIVDNTGKILTADQTGIIIGKYGLKKRGTIIANVECSKSVKEQLEPIGYIIKQIQVGHTFLTLEAKLENAPLGIESSGHLILPEYFLFDDAIVIPLKIAEILDQTDIKLSDIVKEIPTYPQKKEEIKCPDHIKFNVIAELKKKFIKTYNDVNTLDGIRVDQDDGWVLIRASNTSPIIRLTIEADNSEILDEMVLEFNKKITDQMDKTKNLMKEE